MMPDLESQILEGQRVAFLGKLGGVNRKEAAQIVRQHGGQMETVDKSPDLIVVGADELPLDDDAGAITDDLRELAAEGKLEIISETEFWQRLGLVENEQNIHKLYTPAMLAELLEIPVATIRRWQRRGLIAPVREVFKLPYFDFQEVANARRLAHLLSHGVSPNVLEKKLAELARFTPHAERSLAQLSVIWEGREILLRADEGLIDSAGQRRIDFEASELPPPIPEPQLPAGDEPATPEQMLSAAMNMEEAGMLEEAAECYRAALAAGGPSAEVCFQLADVLYRNGEADAARERYFMTLEIDENYVEARVNLGCVLHEQGKLELAAAAFEGALDCYADYPDAHYHLARILDEMTRPDEAAAHWKQFLALAPDSPWADEAIDRLAEQDSPPEW